jgi:hypothetical protein
MELLAYASPPVPALEDRELLLAQDVLDTQVVDLVGRRLSRVSDVFITAGPDSKLEVAAVDVGARSLLGEWDFVGSETGSPEAQPSASSGDQQ